MDIGENDEFEVPGGGCAGVFNKRCKSDDVVGKHSRTKRVIMAITLIICLCMPAWAAKFTMVYNSDVYSIFVETDSIQRKIDASGREYIAVWIKYHLKGELLDEITKEYKVSPLMYHIYFAAFTHTKYNGKHYHYTIQMSREGKLTILLLTKKLSQNAWGGSLQS